MGKDQVKSGLRFAVDTVCFFASFAIYFFLIYVGIKGFRFGMQGIVDFAGYEAIVSMLMLFWPLAIVILIIFIGQIRFAAQNFRDHPVLKTAALIVTAITVIGFVSVGFISKRIKDEKAEDEPARITEYLAARYGEEFASGITIERDNSQGTSYERYYNVYTDVLPSGRFFTVHNDMPSDTDYSNDLVAVFTGCNPDYVNDLNEYVRGEYGIIGMTIQLRINGIDFAGYHYGDDTAALFDRTDFEITGIDMHVDEYTEETIRDCVAEVWEAYQGFSDKTSGFLTIYLNDDQHRCLYVTLSDREEGAAHAEVSDNSGFEDMAQFNGMIINLE